MHLATKFLDAVAMAEDRSSSPLILPWPMPGNLGGCLSFSAFAEWQAFVCDLSLRRVVPDIVTTKFERSQKLLLLAWIDGDLFVAGELIALTALELALRDRYVGKETERRRKSVSFADLLKYMVEQDGLTDAKVPMLQRCGGGTVVGFLTGECKPSLAKRRNDLAHGAPFGSPCAGLFELVRDLIDYAYRDWNLHQTRSIRLGGHSQMLEYAIEIVPCKLRPRCRQCAKEAAVNKSNRTIMNGQ
jgi:hypothetical protein